MPLGSAAGAPATRTIVWRRSELLPSQCTPDLSQSRSQGCLPYPAGLSTRTLLK